VAFWTLATQAKHDLDPARWRDIPKGGVIEGLVRHIILNMSRDQVAGATRAALKLGTIKPEALKPFLEYRATVSDYAVAMLAPRPSPKGAAIAVQIAVQMVFAAAVDALQQKVGPLRLGSPQMIDALTDLITPSLKPTHRAATEDREGAAQGRQGSDRPSTEPTSPAPKPGGPLLRPDVEDAAQRSGASRHRASKVKDRGGAAVRPADVDPQRVKAPTASAGRGRRRKFQVL